MSHEISWRTLWRLPNTLQPGAYQLVSLDTTNDRYVFVLEDTAPVAKAARVYFDSRDKFKRMTPEGFAVHHEVMQERRAELEARDALKAEAYFAALDEVHAFFTKQAQAGWEDEAAYLYDEREEA